VSLLVRRLGFGEREARALGATAIVASAAAAVQGLDGNVQVWEALRRGVLGGPRRPVRRLGAGARAGPRRRRSLAGLLVLGPGRSYLRSMTHLVAALSLVVGFAVADATGVRPLGGIVLAGAAAWCFTRWRAAAGTGRAIALVGFYAAAFAASHALADGLGTWGAVLAVAGAVGIASLLVSGPSRLGAADAGRPSG
jgi:hypothetical protein